ncbi:MAG: FeoB-associated Cys-rich membrane protein [Christensenellaceae bacterium]
MLSTIVISGILIVLVACIIRKMVKDRKSGGCSGNCGSCGSCPHSGQYRH